MNRDRDRDRIQSKPRRNFPPLDEVFPHGRGTRESRLRDGFVARLLEESGRPTPRISGFHAAEPGEPTSSVSQVPAGRGRAATGTRCQCAADHGASLLHGPLSPPREWDETLRALKPEARERVEETRRRILELEGEPPAFL